MITLSTAEAALAELRYYYAISTIRSPLAQSAIAALQREVDAEKLLGTIPHSATAKYDNCELKSVWFDCATHGGSSVPCKCFESLFLTQPAAEEAATVRSPLPCPFCDKSVASLETPAEAHGVDTEDGWTVVCGIHECGCGASCGVRETQEAALLAWNQRTQAADGATAQPKKGEERDFKTMLDQDFIGTLSAFNRQVILRHHNAILATLRAQAEADATERDALRAKLELLKTAIELIWNLALKEKTHLGLERRSGIQQRCIPCICAGALGRGMDGLADAGEFQEIIEELRHH